MKLNTLDIARMIDISLVKSNNSYADFDSIIESAKKYRFVCVFALSSHIPYIRDGLAGEKDILIGCPVGFPSGSETTATKVFQARECLKMGCDEIDMVINLGWLVSGKYKEVKDDINAVIEAAGDMKVKVIIETMLLTDDEIKRAAEIVAGTEAYYIKTGTGWQAQTTTYHHIEVIKEAIGDSKKIKASGGIRTLGQFLGFYKMGIRRMGIGHRAAMEIIRESEKYSQGIDI